LLAKPTPRNINFGSDRFAMFNKQAGHPVKRTAEWTVKRGRVLIVKSLVMPFLMEEAAEP
jgi:hypothetical protein